MFIINSFFKLFLLSLLLAANWSQDQVLPGGDDKFTPYNRANIYELTDELLASYVIEGRKHALSYPVDVTALLIPFRAFENFFKTDDSNALKKIILKASERITKMDSVDDVMEWLGIHPYPDQSRDQGPGPWPHTSQREMDLGLGATLLNTNGAEGLTFSCAACHSADLFGKKIIGLTNRFPRANEFFSTGKRLLPFAHPKLFEIATGASPEEIEILRSTRYAVQFVGTKKPQALGLDTSLAQVALSLARRNKDEYATRSKLRARFPRHSDLKTLVADSKPAVWWNVKYKTRWLSDGSIIQGNPIHTNFLWNEIGRGIDLKSLESWLNSNQKKIDELTATVFATEAPYYLDILPMKTIDLNLAKKGQKHFKNHCMGCHGDYKKNWDSPNAHFMPLAEQVKTAEVWYHKKTPVINVGTDPGRYIGMKAFADELNNLKISKTINTIVAAQEGYVPPPLVGIWARWPYFHNNSAPNLCAVLTRSSERPKIYYSGKAVNPETDYDEDCAGYPTGHKTPESWKNKKHLYNTKKPGLSNQGHDEGIFLENGKELLTPLEKRALIEFLKTL